MDGGKAIAIGKNKDIEAKPASYKYHTVVGEELVEIPEDTVVPASTLIVVTAEVECGENSSYQKGSYTITGTFKIKAKNIKK